MVMQIILLVLNRFKGVLIMDIKILEEAGYKHALYGISLSYNKGIENMDKVSKSLCKLDGGHNKFLESMTVWIDINAPRYWWQEFDTYRIGTTKQSESTIHTLLKSKLTQDNFESDIPEEFLNYINVIIDKYNGKDRIEFTKKIKNVLPEGFLQRRVVCTNYKVLKNIINQRRNHTLDNWKIFISYLKNNLEHSDLIF